MFTKIQTYLAGKKTYLVAIAGIITAVAGWATGDLTLAQLIEAIFVAAGFGAVRAGIEKK